MIWSGVVTVGSVVPGLVHDGAVAMVVDPQRDLDRVEQLPG